MGYVTELLFQRDSYLREFDARVVTVDAAGSRVALDRTAFYAGGGGQPNDTGVLRLHVFQGAETPEVSVPVTAVKKERAPSAMAKSSGTLSAASCRRRARR